MYSMIPLITIVMSMWTLMYILSMKKKSSTKPLSPYECGFNLMHSNMPLSIQFTTTTFIFLLFDIELSILISSNWKMHNIMSEWIVLMVIFLMMMMAGVIYEILKKSYKWN